jgi:hypothetical protein
MSARLLDGDGSAVLMATRLGRRNPAPLLVVALLLLVVVVGAPLVVVML